MTQVPHNKTWGKGLAILQSNRPEDLRAVLVSHLRQAPLAPLETEVILVQSNGIARWLELALAADPERGGLGISAATEFMLPSRFFWTLYRQVLGAGRVPEISPFDAASLRWHIHALLPPLLDRPDMAPLAHYLEHDPEDALRRWQLASQLAELYEQYQIYRADWLLSWEAGRNDLVDFRGKAQPLEDRQRWQPLLWRKLVATANGGASGSRAHLHQDFVERLENEEKLPAGLLPRRVTVFGISSLPAQVIQALAAVARHSQVLVCLHNPCRHYWADIIQDRDLLRSRPGKRLSLPPDWPAELVDELINKQAEESADELAAELINKSINEHLHQLANPLLAAWGRQGRDFFALLDELDEPERYRQWFDRIDLFSDHVSDSGSGSPPASLLAGLQQGILDLQPEPEKAAGRQWVAASEHSIRFHVVHSRQREVEILHDQLLALFEADAGLQPREIIVMVPDIDEYAPHIEAVFGTHSRSASARHIPFSIGDRRSRLASPLLAAFTRLLRLPDLRLTSGEVLDLLSTPAVAQRFNLAEDELERIRRWLTDVGIRWGLHAEHRRQLGIDPPFETNSWRFGLRRMLLGYAAGNSPAFEGIQPFDEVAGSEAELAGRLLNFIDVLEQAWQALIQPAQLADWAERLGRLADDFFSPADEADEQARAALDQALEQLRRQAETSKTQELLALEVVRDAFMHLMDSGQISQRFLAGKVNFSTLMPMRAIPFRVVCLLGMNDDAYPRTRKPADFDLMSQPGLFRPGDRSRREDDRYLFLEALLSARERLHISWVGRDIRTDEELPPSVLVGQLRDHIAAGWQLAGVPEDKDAGEALLDQLTITHPLQPFSRRYFRGDERLFTYAAEWRQAHDPAETASPDLGLDRLPPARDLALSVGELAGFLTNPVQAFTQRRLGARLKQEEQALPEDEPLTLRGLERWQLEDAWIAQLGKIDDAQRWPAELERLQHAARSAGHLPLDPTTQAELEQTGQQMLALRQELAELQALWPKQADPYRATFACTLNEGQEAVPQEAVLQEWLPSRQRNEVGQQAFFETSVSDLRVDKKGDQGKFHPRWDKLARWWPRHLLAAASGLEVRTIVLFPEGQIDWPALDAERASQWLGELIVHWQEGLRRPLPLAPKTATLYLSRQTTWAVEGGAGLSQAGINQLRSSYEGGWRGAGELGYTPALARFYPNLEALLAHPGDDLIHWAQLLYGPMLQLWQEGLEQDKLEQGKNS